MESLTQTISLAISLGTALIIYKANPIFNHERLKMEKIKLYEIFSNIENLDSPSRQEALYLESVFQIITGCSEPYIKIKKILTIDDRLIFLDNMKKLGSLFFYYKNGQLSLVYRNIKKQLTIFTIAFYGYLIFGLGINIFLLIIGGYGRASEETQHISSQNQAFGISDILIAITTISLSIIFLYHTNKSQKKLRLMMKLIENENSRYDLIFNRHLPPYRRFFSFLSTGNKMITRKLKRATHKNTTRISGLLKRWHLS